MKYVVAFVAVFSLATLGVSAMPHVRVLGVTPDLVLIFAACWAVVRGQDEAMVIVPMAGFMKDLTTSDPLGTSVLAMLPLVLLAAAVQMRAVDSDFVPSVVVVAAGTLVASVITMLVLAATGQHIAVGDALVRVTIPAAVVNALFTAVVYLPVNWLSPKQHAGLLGSGRPISSL